MSYPQPPTAALLQPAQTTTSHLYHLHMAADSQETPLPSVTELSALADELVQLHSQTKTKVEELERYLNIIERPQRKQNRPIEKVSKIKIKIEERQPPPLIVRPKPQIREPEKIFTPQSSPVVEQRRRNETHVNCADRKHYYRNFGIDEPFIEVLIGEDYTKAKVSQQIPITTLWQYLEPFLRPYNAEDIAFLLREPDAAHYYTIPPLGVQYKAEEIGEDLEFDIQHTRADNPLNANKDITSFSPEMYAPPLVERLLACLLGETMKSDGSPWPQGQSIEDVKEYSEDFEEEDEYDEYSNEEIEEMDVEEEVIPCLEDRLKHELRCLGLWDDEDPVLSNEDDPISVALRECQAKLREQMKINSLRRNRLVEHIKKRLGFQEYQDLLDDISKHLEEAFWIRYTPKTKKKSKTTTEIVKSESPILEDILPKLSEGTIALMNKYSELQATVGCSFFARDEEYWKIPQKSIFFDLYNNLSLN